MLKSLPPKGVVWPQLVIFAYVLEELGQIVQAEVKLQYLQGVTKTVHPLCIPSLGG